MVLLNRNLYLQWINQSNPSSSSWFLSGGVAVSLGRCWGVRGAALWLGTSVCACSQQGSFVAGKQQRREEMCPSLPFCIKGGRGGRGRFTDGLQREGEGLLLLQALCLPSRYVCKPLGLSLNQELFPCLRQPGQSKMHAAAPAGDLP